MRFGGECGFGGQALWCVLSGVCSRTVQRYVERAKRDALVPTPKPGRPPRLAREQEAAFVALLEESPNWTLLGLQEQWHKQSGVFLPDFDPARLCEAPGRALQKRVASPESVAR